MRIRNTQYEPQCSSSPPQSTFRSLFSRRSKRIPRRTSSIKRRSSTSIIFPNNTNPSRNDSTTSTSTTSSSRTVRANGLRLNKELEILGLLTHPADVNSPVFLDTISNRTREAAPTPASHSPPIFPIARLHEEPWWADHEEEEDTLPPSTRSRQDYPPSPLLPPPPSRSLPPAPAQQPKLQLQPPLNLTPPFNTTKPLPMPPAASEDITPPSPAFTFATRSSGIFPCGAEPSFTDRDGGACVVDDSLSEDVLVLPSPPRFVGAYRYLPAGINV
ncbi:uncharacterized protein BDV14DRAFT_75618 [Aspergillus stella-maris]|uniref:uncharacterized protein n=1 Tax=Aspergillus stella-maris TaxID=1810926 RepID=UPI003CCCBF42